MRHSLSILILLATALAFAPAKADLPAGLKAYKAGDFKTALREFRKAADAGNRNAQFNLGVMYLTGKGVKKNMAQAVKWHRAAADKELPQAQHGLAVMYLRGDGVTQDFSEAAKWFRRAAAQNYPNSQFNLGVLFFQGQGVPKDDAEVVKWITLAAARRFPPALFQMGFMYETGAIFRADPAEALTWYSQGALTGHPESKKKVDDLARQLKLDPKKVLARIQKSMGQRRPQGARPASRTASRPAAAPSRRATAPRQATKPAPARKAPAQTAAAPSSGSAPAGWRIQLASFRSQGEARSGWERLKAAHGEALGALQPIFDEVNLGTGRGVFVRLQAGPFANASAARQACSRIRQKAPNQGCLPQPPKG